MPKDAYFFSHDANARTDPKILACRSVYGNEGYALYFMLLEIFREQDNYKLPITKYTYDALAMQLQCQRNTIEKFIMDCSTDFADKKGTLLCKDDNFIWSDSFLKRMAKVDKIREENRNSAIKGWDKRKMVNTQSQPIAIAEQTNAKAMQGEEKRIEENIIEENRGDKDAATKISNLIKIYEGNIGIITPMVLRELNDICDVYPDGWFEEATEEAVRYNARNLQYIKTILEKWFTKGKNNSHKPQVKKNDGWD